MSPGRVPSDLSGREVRRALERAGFVLDRQEGSHMVLEHSNPHFIVVVPDHRVVRVGTLRKIIRDAKMSVDEFLTFL